MLLVEDTVRGLRRGAPVEYRGVRVGTVEQVPWRFTAEQPDSLNRFSIPVLIRIEPQRIAGDGDVLLDDWRRRMERMFQRGMRASLKSGNLLTGALFVDVQVHQDAPEYRDERFENVPVFPTVSGGLAQIEGQIAQLLETLNGLPLQDIAEGLDRNLAASEGALQEIAATADRLEKLLGGPDMQRLPGRLNDTLSSLEDTLDGLSAGGDGRQIGDTLQRLEKVLRDVEPVLRTLRQQPNALIFQHDPPADPVPKAQPHD